MAATKTIEIDLGNWCGGAPTGAVIYNGTVGNWTGVIDSEYCDTAEDFKEFVSRHADELDPYSSELTFHINAADVSTSNVMDAACEIADGIAYILG